MIKDPAARRRASFAAADRRKKEAALTADLSPEALAQGEALAKAEKKAARTRKAGQKRETGTIEDRQQPADQSETRIIRTKRKTYVLPGDAEGIPLSERYPGSRLPDRFKDLKIYQTPDGPVIARSEETRKNQPRRADGRKAARRETGRTAQQQRQTDRKAGQQKDQQRKIRDTFNRLADKDAARKDEQQRAARAAATAQKRVADATRKADQRRDRQRKEQVRREFNRGAEDKKAAEQKQTAVKQQKQAAANQEARKRADERKAAAWVAARQKAQAADSLAEERRQTDRLRNRHREENRSLKSNESAALDRHWHAIRRIDGAEQRALDEFDVKRAGLTGRAVELAKGKQHFDRQREAIAKQHEADRRLAVAETGSIADRARFAGRPSGIRRAPARSPPTCDGYLERLFQAIAPPQSTIPSRTPPSTYPHAIVPVIVDETSRKDGERDRLTLRSTALSYSFACMSPI